MYSYKRTGAKRGDKGFTIVELLVVIVVIGILAAVTIVAFNGVSQKAHEASLASDLTGAATKLSMYRVENDAYPISNDCTTSQSPAPPKICLPSSGSNTFSTYIVDTSTPGSPHYKLVATDGKSAFYVTDLEGPTKTSLIGVAGGAVTTDSAYTIRTFTSSGILSVTGGTLTNVSALVIGGGGGGGVAASGYSAGAGGGGQFLELSGLSVSGTTTVTVGNGGAVGANGGVSVFGTQNAIGGGAGAATFGVGANGANGGGGGMAGRAGGIGTAGFNGGAGGAYPSCGGGEPGSGGGAGAVGGAGGACIGGQGGIGKASSITGSSVYYAGGGSVGSVAPLGGGGGAYPPVAGTPNTGGGGASNKPGGSGVVIIRYLTP